MTKEQVVEGYLINSPKVVAEMLYETIERYEAEVKRLKNHIKALDRMLEDYDDPRDMW